MKIINFIVYLSIFSSITPCSITRELNLSWNIICNAELIVQVRASSHGTYFTTKRGSICDLVQNRTQMSALLALSIAQSIEQRKISENKTAFFIPTTQSRNFVLVYDSERPIEIAYFDINQPSKTFASDPEEVQELKKIIQQGQRSQN